MCAFASAPSWGSASPSTHTSTYTGDVTGSPAAAAPQTSQATLRWAQGEFCPVQYRSPIESEAGITGWSCAYAGAVEVTIGGQLWNRTWWNMGGDSVTEWTAAARSALPNTPVDDRFERDYDAWRLRQEQLAAPQPEQGLGG